jgi:hypothetical protein
MEASILTVTRALPTVLFSEVRHLSWLYSSTSWRDKYYTVLRVVSSRRCFYCSCDRGWNINQSSSLSNPTYPQGAVAELWYLVATGCWTEGWNY